MVVIGPFSTCQLSLLKSSFPEGANALFYTGFMVSEALQISSFRESLFVRLGRRNYYLAECSRSAVCLSYLAHNTALLTYLPVFFHPPSLSSPLPCSQQPCKLQIFTLIPFLVIDTHSLIPYNSQKDNHSATSWQLQDHPSRF